MGFIFAISAPDGSVIEIIIINVIDRVIMEQLVCHWLCYGT